MKVENKDGIIDIVFDGFLSSLIIKDPRIADWPDCEGTIARYYACFPTNPTNRKELKNLEENIKSIKSLNDFIESGFTKLLKSGNYEFELWEDKPTEYLYNTSLINSNKIIFNWHKERIGKYRVAKPYSPNSYYPYGRQLMFTEPFESLDPERIKHYENLITKGERPKAIVIRLLNMEQEDEDGGQPMTNTTKYILDGHHKLIAYKNKKINPHYIVINKLSETDSKEKVNSILPKLEKLLYPYQQEHIITRGIDSIYNPTSEFTEYFDSYLEQTPRIEETLIKRMYSVSRNFHSQYHEIDLEKREWFENRLNTFKKRIESKQEELTFTYYCTNDKKQKHQKISEWETIENIINQ